MKERSQKILSRLTGKLISSLGLIAVLTILPTSCKDAFMVHPYAVKFHGPDNITAWNKSRIIHACRDKEIIKVAVISDSHLWLKDLEAQIDDINRREDIDFVIHCGDLTDTGTTMEFVWTRDELERLNVPYIALIGNHDFLGTGENTYAAMFGIDNFSFIAGKIKFVCLNTNATEYDYMAAVPNFDFMENEMLEDNDKYERSIIVMHAPPYSDQFNNNVVKSFGRYVRSFPGIMFCIAGHNHVSTAEEIYKDGIIYFGIDCASHRNYMIFTISTSGYSYEKVEF